MIKQDGRSVQIETPGELSAVLRWLSDAPISDVYIQPVGLRAVYDRFHHQSPITSQAEAAV